jgi:putative signal transducing protein
VDASGGPGDDDGVRLIPVFESLDPVRGLLIRGLLESDGIRVLAKGEGTGPYRMGPVILLVAEDDAARARELVAASEAGTLDLAPDEGPATGLPD